MAESDFGLDDLNKLSADLTQVPNVLQPEVKASLNQAAFHTRDEWRKDAAKGVLGRQYADSIDFEEREFGAFGQGVLEVNVGPNLARYGGRTGKGGLVPSAGIFDDPESSGGIKGAKPSRARRKAEKFAEKELVERLEVAVDESLKKLGL